MIKRILIVMSALLLTWTGSSWAELYNADLVCRDQPEELSVTQYLRSLSLDLRGTTPTLEEYQQVQDAGEVPESLIDAWLQSPEFTQQAIRFHGAILWPNLDGLRMITNNMMLTREGPTGLHYRRNAATLFRGDRVPCRDEPEPDQTLENIVKIPMEDGTAREGYVLIEPYWAPGTEIKVCAWDAQSMDISPTGTHCDRPGGHGDPKCGCGPDMRWCGFNNEGLIRQAFLEDLNRRVAWMVENDRPYTDLLTRSHMYVNGVLTHYYRHMAHLSNAFKIIPYATDLALLPELTYMDQDKWVEIKLPTHHSGVLTSPAYLLRFQTNRSRANEYQNNFLCKPFQPPPGGLPGSDDASALEMDLQKRAGCKYCHTDLEPKAAYWGRWPETTTSYLNSTDFPAFSEECHDCAHYGGCSSTCNTYYVTKSLADSEKPYFGWLKSYLFRYEKDRDNVEEGPHLLVKRTTYSYKMPSCLSRHAMRWLVGRDAHPQEEPWLAEVVGQFMNQNLNFRDLVKAVVTSPLYRRVR